MLFTSYAFICFLSILFLLYYLLPAKYQWILLLAFSYIFYACSSPKYLIYIGISTVVVYATTQKLQRIADEKREYLEKYGEQLSKSEKKAVKQARKAAQRKWLAAGLVINFGILFGVKYINFFIGNTNILLNFFGSKTTLSTVNMLMPLGISFYTLQACGYMIDVYRNVVSAERNFFKTALFISFFPQLIQGPISRFSDLSKTLYSQHSFNIQQFTFGLQRILWGFFKKMVIADCVLAGVSTIIGDLGKYNGCYIFVVLFLYTLELYADFTGGIDITIGIAQSLGICLAENFRQPYFSKSLKEYWRRWHITMCEWFRSYVFFPVSAGKATKKITKFSRKHFGEYAGSRIPVYLASFLTWFATGIWHGASWNFIVWGLLNWLILMFSEEIEPLCVKFHEKRHWNEKSLYKIFQILRTFLLVSCLNLFDCYSTVSETMYAFMSMFTVHNFNILTDGSLLNIGLKVSDYAVLLIGAILMLYVSLIQRNGSVRERIAAKPYVLRAVI